MPWRPLPAMLRRARPVLSCIRARPMSSPACPCRESRRPRSVTLSSPVAQEPAKLPTVSLDGSQLDGRTGDRCSGERPARSLHPANATAFKAMTGERRIFICRDFSSLVALVLWSRVRLVFRSCGRRGVEKSVPTVPTVSRGKTCFVQRRPVRSLLKFGASLLLALTWIRGHLSH